MSKMISKCGLVQFWLTFSRFATAQTQHPTSWFKFFQPLAECYPIVTVQDWEQSPALKHPSEREHIEIAELARIPF